MSSYVSAASKAGDQFLARLGALQDAWLKHLTTIQAPVPGLAPLVQPRYLALHEVTDAGFAFSEKLLAQQRKFAMSLYDAGASKPARPAATKRKTRARTGSPDAGRSRPRAVPRKH